MKVLGLITEYNPFHNGHIYHINEAKKKSKCDYTIAIMSGHFLQRGIPAILNKWERAKNSLKNGVDLVIELPVISSLNSAEYFSEGAINILDKLSIIDTIIFGSEFGKIENFEKISKVLVNEPNKFKNNLKENLNKGLSFPKARDIALKNYFKKDILIKNKPNNILGIEYAKALYKNKSSIKLDTIKRTKNEYHQKTLTKKIASATAIRNSIKNKNIENVKSVIPKSTYESLKNSPLIYKEDFEEFIIYKLRSISPKKLSLIQDVTEGLENRIIEKAHKENSIEKLIASIKTKRYTYTKIQRILFNTLLSIEKKHIDTTAYYARILGFNKKGQEIIKHIKNNSNLPLITNLKHYKPENKQAYLSIEKDILATNIYHLIYPQKPSQLDYYKKPIIL